MKRRSWLIRILVACIAIGAISLVFWLRPDGKTRQIEGTQQFEKVSKAVTGLMNTESTLTAVVIDKPASVAEEAIMAAIKELQRVEYVFSTYRPNTELARLNQAPAGKIVPLSKEMLYLLKLSRKLAGQTGGAFDVTVGPVLRLWAQAGKAGRVPTQLELDKAKSQTGWDLIEIVAGGARKKIFAASVDLGGIAKGYAIDRAVEVLKQHGCAGGLINIGGDIRCFGKKEDGSPWQIALEDPFNPRSGKYPARVGLAGGSVCTSGNYFRFSTIGGKRFSHIVDPRTARPAEMVPSVTVIADTAVIADAWATALSVLGPAGLEIVNATDGIEAMLTTGSPENYTHTFSKGFSQHLLKLDGKDVENPTE